MEPLDRERILALLRRAVGELRGEWLLLGGAAAAVWFSPDRTTEDLDVVGLPGTPEPRLQLLGFAAREGVPVEALNSAADFFVQQVPGWHEGTTPLVAGPQASIRLPSATVFLLTKVSRLSGADLADCLGLLAHARQAGLGVDAARVRAALRALPPPASPEQAARRRRLRAALRSGRGGRPR